MPALSLGEMASFQPDGNPILFGATTKYNRKTLTVITEGGRHWTVAPNFLHKMAPAREAAPETARVINLLKN